MKRAAMWIAMLGMCSLSFAQDKPAAAQNPTAGQAAGQAGSSAGKAAAGSQNSAGI